MIESPANNQDITKLVEDLQASPMFNLSLASKELFHSNFIAWMFNEYKYFMSDFLNLFDQHIGKRKSLEAKPIDACITKREKKHIDLTICDNSDKTIAIIENKVKSVATEKQLSEYNRIPAEIRILLSLSKPHFIKGTEDENGIIKFKISSYNTNGKEDWYFINYGRFAEFVKESIKINDKLKPSAENLGAIIKEYYPKSLIEDYTKMISILHKMFTNSEIFKKDDSFMPSNQYLFKSKLSDLYIKLHYNALYIKMKEKFESDLKNKPTIISNLWNGAKKGVGSIFLNYGYSNSTGYLDYKRIVWEFPIDNTHGIMGFIAFGIQIQGKQFRFVVETSHGPALKLAEALGPNLWLDYISSINIKEDFQIISKDRKLRGKSITKYPGTEDYIPYPRYGEGFRYKYINLESKVNTEAEVTIDNVLHKIFDIHRALEEFLQSEKYKEISDKLDNFVKNHVSNQ